MELVDILFPQNIGPLTYRVPKQMRQMVRPGLMVEAEVRKRIKRGVIAGPPSGTFKSATPLKELSAIVHDSPSLSPELLELVLWVSRYYACREGLALKGAFPPELFEPVKKRGTGKLREPLAPYIPSPPDERSQEAIRTMRRDEYANRFHAFLHLAASTRQEIGFALNAVGQYGSAIVVVPDKSYIAHILPALRSMAGERLIEFHSGLNKGQRTEALRRMSSGHGDIVLGSLSAVFAPMPRPSLICVLSEESSLYKAEGSPRYSARDAAVMRAYLEGSHVLLGSICPSVESWHNADTGKYTLLDTATGAPRPRVRIINLFGQGKAISNTLETAVQKASEEGKRAFLFLNRKGYSMLRCNECGHLDQCPECEIPMVYHKEERSLKCGYCGRTKRLYEACPACRGTTVSVSGMGLERIEDELSSLLPVGVDSLRRENLSLIADDTSSLAVGTKTLTRTAALSGTAAIAAVLNADALLHTPDFRSRERAFQDMLYASDMASHDGELIVQTRLPGHAMFSHLRDFNLRKFFEMELKERREAEYPPYTRLAVIDLRSKDAPDMVETGVDGVEALGPVPTRLRPRKGRESDGHRLLLKAPNRDALHRAIENLRVTLKKFDIDIDVDPLGF